MPTLRRSVASLASLASFEAAARHGSFTLAAAELGVTQAAVSRQIRRLEEDLNTPLFVRSHRKVELTARGQVLASVMTDAFERVAETIEAIREPLVEDTVIVGATLAFSHFWLVPRLSAFRAAHPEIRLRLVSEDATFDLRDGRLDVVVRYGEPPFADARSLASQPDEVFPVCSPALRDRAGPDMDLGRILDLPLIGLDRTEPEWLSWPRWAALVGIGEVPERTAIRFNHYTDAIYAAMAGQGVVLGWQRLLAGPLAEGKLVRLTDRPALPPEGYHVLWPLGRRPSRATSLFTEWMVAQFAPASA